MNPMGMANRFGKKGLVSAFLAGSLIFGGTAYAENVGVTDARKITFSNSSTAFAANKNIVNLTDTVAGLTDKGSPFAGNVAKQLQRTAIHESGQLKHVVQVGGGPARSIFQVEPRTAFDVLDRISKRSSNVLSEALEQSSGKTMKELRGMWQWQMDAMLRENQLFAGVLARGAYNKSGRMIPAADFPVNVSASDDFWMKNYNRSRKSVRATKQKRFLADNVRFQRKLNPVLNAGKKKIGHNAGNASTKAFDMVKNTLRKVITKR